MRRHRLSECFGAAIGILLLSGGASFGGEPAGESSCPVAPALTRLGAPLLHASGRIAAGNTLTILAVGSSSTQGVGASSPAMSYPSRLESELHRLFPTIAIRIVNRGHRGQDVADELAGLNQDLVREHPDLIVWQVGTNALLRRQDLSVVERLISQEAAEIKGQGVDVVLMDMQYAPRVLARNEWSEMERVIARVSRREGLGYFRRFEIMRDWERRGDLAPSALIGRDGLHMTDVSYNCLAEGLAHALADQWQSENKVAKSPNRNPATLARGAQRAVADPH